MAPVYNPNLAKSKRLLDAQITEDKLKITKAKKRLERKFERNFNKWREFDLLTCLIALVGLALSIVDWEYSNLSAKRIADQYYCPTSSNCYEEISN